MADPTLCEACKAVLVKDKATFMESKHHETANLFRLANELGCEICIRLRAAFVEEYNWPKHKIPVREHEALRTVISEDSTLAWGPTSCLMVSAPLHGLWYGLLFCNNVEDSTFFAELLFGTTGTVQPPKIVACKNTGEHQALAFAQAQYIDCLRRHDKCQSSLASSEFLPTRVLQVHGAEDSCVRLCERAQIPLGTQYAALSHCWGQAQPTSLTKFTEKDLRQGVLRKILPLTFQHAIRVAIALNVSHLWIDSMCIFQDDLEDWESEANLMRDVYRNATFCIAATAAKDGNHGLFQDRDSRLLEPFLVAATWQFTLRNGGTLGPGEYWCMLHPVKPRFDIDSAPLNERAWVAQERFLSRRTIHFTDNLIFWECCEKFSSETHPNEHFSCWCGHRDSDPRSIKRLVIDTKFHQKTQNGDARHGGIGWVPDPETVDELYRSWREFRAFYTKCQLTKDSDTLVALRGVSLEIGELLGDKLVFGLWMNRLTDELAWRSHAQQNEKISKTSSLRAPSWSWASSKSVIRVGVLSENAPSYQAGIHRMVQIMKPPEEMKSSANMHSHSIVMRCRLIASCFQYTVMTQNRIFRRSDKMLDPCIHFTLMNFGTVRPKTMDGIYIWIDDTSRAADWETNSLECQILILRCVNETNDDREFDGLLLVLRDDQTNAYERIGYCWIFEQSLQDYGEGETRTASQILDFHSTLEDQEIRLI